MRTDADLYNAHWLADHYRWPIARVREMTLSDVNHTFAFLTVKQERQNNG